MKHLPKITFSVFKLMYPFREMLHYYCYTMVSEHSNAVYTNFSTGLDSPSVFDNAPDTVISMIANKLLACHSDFLRNRGICMFCCCSTTPEEFKSEK